MALASACASVGPATIGRDRLDYDHSVAESWKRQLLLNLVKLRYGDAPLFLDIASITNSYGIETQLTGAVGWADVVSSGISNSQSLAAGARYTDKPTITYSPLTGNRFTTSLMTPVSPAVVISLIQAGWAADAVLRLMVTSLNGVQNRFAMGGRARGADPEFYRLVAALRRIQASGAIGMKMQKLTGSEPQVAVLVLVSGTSSDASLDRDRREVREILHLGEDVDEVKISFGSGRGSPDEIAMVTRSMLEMLLDLSGSAIEVPPSHVAQGRTPPTRSFDTDSQVGFVPLVRVQSGCERPCDAFVAVTYRGAWFWVDDSDYGSKAIFTFMLILSSLTESEPSKAAPVITIPAG
jgi:hypothetical protein